MSALARRHLGAAGSDHAKLKGPTMKAKGAGDVVAAATKALGIKPCEGCERRREAFNRALPFPKRATDFKRITTHVKDGLVIVEGRLNGVPFRAAVAPDEKRVAWLEPEDIPPVER